MAMKKDRVGQERYQKQKNNHDNNNAQSDQEQEQEDETVSFVAREEHTARKHVVEHEALAEYFAFRVQRVREAAGVVCGDWSLTGSDS